MTQTIGQQLKQIRENLDITLDEISQRTRIRMAYLEAIESNDIESLPSKTHMRGFLRLYASELGVKLEDLKITGERSSKEPEDDGVTRIRQEVNSPSEETLESDMPNDAFEEKTKPPTEVDLSPAEGMKTSHEELPAQGTSKQKQSDEIFKAIGEKLRSRREKLSLSIDDIHKNIHVPKKHLTLLETGQFGGLHSPVQAKGMLQNYASFLNLDVDSLLLDFSDGLQLQRREKQISHGKNRRSAKEVSPTTLQIRNIFSLDLLVILALFIVFATFLIWGINRILAADSPVRSEADIPGVSDVLLAPVTPTIDLLLTTNDLDSEEVIEDLIQEDEPPFVDPITSTDPINIIIIPRQRVWVQIISDLNLVFEGRLLPGNVYDYSGQETVDILVANAGAVQIFFNDQDLGTPGLHGQLASLTFTTTGLVQPTPTITPTMTATPETTPTPSATPTPTPLEENDQTD